MRNRRRSARIVEKMQVYLYNVIDECHRFQNKKMPSPLKSRNELESYNMIYYNLYYTYAELLQRYQTYIT